MAWEVSDKSVSWGLPGDTPVIGDWNGDGKDDIGIFRPGSGLWSLDSNGNTAWEVSDKSVSWGMPGDTPVIGDWNGDGKDDIGIFRPGSGLWSLDSNGNNAWEVSDKSVSWGMPGDIPVIGDWNGDGKDDIGIFRPGSGLWSLDSNGNSKWDISDKSVSWGLPGDTPVTGDWNGDGKDDIGTFRQGFGAESNPTGNPVGGGTGYTRILSPTDPRVKYVVSTKDQLLTALKNVKSGEVIFVPGNANINLTGTYGIVIPGGVTLASDRGSSGSPGGRIFRYRVANENEYVKIPTFVIGGDNVRITGLRIEGQDVIQDEPIEEAGLEIKSAIKAIGKNGSEVDNCEIWGWSHGAVTLENSGSAYIHHNFIHHCQANGYGYGVALDGGKALIEANKFDYTRHAIEAEGKPGEGYEARYNIHLGHGEAIGGHHFDVHGYAYNGGTIAGDEYKIHHNTFEVTRLYSSGYQGKTDKRCLCGS